VSGNRPARLAVGERHPICRAVRRRRGLEAPADGVGVEPLGALGVARSELVPMELSVRPGSCRLRAAGLCTALGRCALALCALGAAHRSGLCHACVSLCSAGSAPLRPRWSLRAKHGAPGSDPACLWDSAQELVKLVERAGPAVLVAIAGLL